MLQYYPYYIQESMSICNVIVVHYKKYRDEEFNSKWDICYMNTSDTYNDKIALK